LKPLSGINKQEDTYRGPERRTGQLPPDNVLPVVLSRKLAEVVDDIDLTAYCVGDRLPLEPAAARLLMAEGWAHPSPRRDSDH
jgi:hypothetical protein